MTRLIVGGIDAPQTQAQSAGRVSVGTQVVTGADRLIESLKGAQVALGGINKLTEVKQQEDEAAADAYYRSMTLDEIGKKVKAGELPPDASPVFRARVENLYGSNYLGQVERDARTKLENGEFDSPEAFDKYLTETRNGFLQGASKYTVAGFDKQFLTLKENFQTLVQKQATAQRFEEVVGASSENLVNTLSGIEKKDEFGVAYLPPEAVSQALETYRKDAAYLTLPPAQRKAVLSNVVQEFVLRGDEKGLKAFLDSQLDNGLTVGTAVAGKDRTKIRQVLSMAREADFKKNSVVAEEWHDKLSKQAETGDLDIAAFEKARTRFDPYKDWGGLLRLNETVQRNRLKEADKVDAKIAFQQGMSRLETDARNRVRTVLASGNVVNMPDQVLTNEHGTDKTIKEEDLITAAIEAETQGDPLRRMQAYSRFNYTDFASKQELLQGHTGILSAAQPNGTPPETVQQNLDTFRQYNQTNPAYTKQLMGETQYNEMLLADQMVTRFRLSPAETANTLLRVRQSSLTGGDVEAKKLGDKVDAAFSEFKDPGLFKKLGTSLFGSQAEKDLVLGGDAVRGLANVEKGLAGYAKALAISGMAKDGQEAVQMAMDTAVKNGSIVRANGAFYWRHDLPSRLPQGVEPPQAMQEYRAGVATAFRNAGLALDEESIELSSNGNGSFTVFYRDANTGRYSTPLLPNGSPFVATHAMIEKYAAQRQLARDRQLVEESRPAAKRDKVARALGGKGGKTTLAIGGASLPQ